MKLTMIRGGVKTGVDTASILLIETDTHAFHLEVDKDGALLIRADDPFKDITAQPSIVGIGDDMIGLKLRTE